MSLVGTVQECSITKKPQVPSNSVSNYCAIIWIVALAPNEVDQITFDWIRGTIAEPGDWWCSGHVLKAAVQRLDWNNRCERCGANYCRCSLSQRCCPNYVDEVGTIANDLEKDLEEGPGSACSASSLENCSKAYPIRWKVYLALDHQN